MGALRFLHTLALQDIITRHGVAITAEALDDMSYAAAVAKELLRITPAVPAVFRVAVVDFELQGNKIPKVCYPPGAGTASDQRFGPVVRRRRRCRSLLRMKVNS